ncbi:hypothetical protein IP88_03230 [alpha proteobacterium AAP81b]|nr:hypothetical protein IP88_03230 [alpha proteobacterium AAP81b]
MRRGLGVGAALLLAGCTTPSQRITTALASYGVPPARAQCMGERLGSRLSVGQLLRLQQIAGTDGGKLRRLSLRQIADRLTDDRDPELVAAFVAAGIACVL